MGWNVAQVLRNGMLGMCEPKLKKESNVSIQRIYLTGLFFDPNLMTVKEEIERSGAKIIAATGRRQITPATDAFREDMADMFRRYYYSVMAQRRRWALARRRNRR